MESTDKENLQNLLSIIAHDIKRPMSNLTMLSKLIPSKKDDPEFIQNQLDKIMQEAQIVQEMIANVRHYLDQNDSIPENPKSLS